VARQCPAGMDLAGFRESDLPETRSTIKLRN